jgi:hypothetical protein
LQVTSKLRHMKRTILFLLTIALPLGLWGYAYETSYFLALGISPLDTLNLRHYVVSGGTLIMAILIPLIVFSQLDKFFTKRIHVNDAKSMKDQLAKADFSREVKGARIAVLLSMLFWFVVYFQPRLHLPQDLSSQYFYMVFVNLMLFYSSIAISPPYSRATVIFAFVVSVAICFSAGGYGEARRQSESKNVLRDDHIVRIERIDGKIVAIPNDLPIPTSWLSLLKRVAG